ncbi:MAG TPA: hypothetical protein VKB15_10005, partial [Xanthobacteraceae bacterium]|nr:hypothetical protein [Xanthobacteraceae bacterium]
SRAAVAEMRKLIEWPEYNEADAFQLNKVINEPDFLPLHVVRILAQSATLMRAQRGKLLPLASRSCGFRRLRPGIPIERGHAFRSKAATCSGEGGRGVVAGMRSWVRISWLRQDWRVGR